MARFLKGKLKAYRKQYYSSNTKKALQLKGLNYKCNTDIRNESERESYHSKPASEANNVNIMPCMQVHYRLHNTMHM